LEIKKLRGKIVVLAIPRGGVVIGKIISRVLNCPLDVLITRKIGAPGNPELAVGAVGPLGIRIVNWELAKKVGADQNYLKAQIENLKKEIKEREEKFRKGKPELKIAGKNVILTDDGIATGATIEAAIAWLKSQKVKRIILAVPVAPSGVIEKLKPLVDELIVLEEPEFFAAVGQFYREFEQVKDEEVAKILNSK
jgi:putative phosphoribosyl transferase